MTIKPEDYIYPTSDERNNIYDNFPKIDSFNFKATNIMESLWEDSLPIEEVHKLDNLYYWDKCLINRIAKIRETYIFAMANYNRGFSDEYSACKTEEVINHILFDYYSEIFFYFFSSTVDIITQIVNVYFAIGFDEDKVFFRQVINKLKDEAVKDAFNVFDKETSQTSMFRNGFTHRYTPNLPDLRSELSSDKQILGFGSSKVLQSKEIVASIENSLNGLSTLMTSLKKTSFRNKQDKKRTRA